ncbi:sigma factor [Amycolatopsis sp. NPDC051903]|uniref:sigma factor n=1 Tax=Amycolatopsis sp. NPDC051903 TaxID=3363936 RepID=UPI0037B360FB
MPGRERGAAPAQLLRAQPDDVLEKAAAGEGEAVRRVLPAMKPFVVRYCRARLGRQEDEFRNADDVAQEICLAVLTALPGYRASGRPFLAFVYDIARRIIASVPGGAEPGGGRHAVGGRMTELMRILPERQREILVLRVVVGLSAEETAEALGATAAAVLVQQDRALIRLREELHPADG